MGVEKEILTAGNGPKPVPGQKVTVHCTGFGKNGDLSQKFWSTKDPGPKEKLSKDGMKVCWECNWEKLLDYGALPTMPMVLADFQHGVFSPTQFWFLRLKF